MTIALRKEIYFLPEPPIHPRHSDRSVKFGFVFEDNEIKSFRYCNPGVIKQNKQLVVDGHILGTWANIPDCPFLDEPISSNFGESDTGNAAEPDAEVSDSDDSVNSWEPWQSLARLKDPKKMLLAMVGI